MKLLFNQNLSPHLVKALADLFSNSVHVRDADLERASDRSIREFARQNGFTIVTKDAEFQEWSLGEKHPPKIIWVRAGNCATPVIVDLLRRHAIKLQEFSEHGDKSFLVLL